MAFNVNEFIAAGLPLGGARPSLFSVLFDTPSGIPNIGPRVSFTCRASQLPAAHMGVIIQRYFGREVKLAGNRTFDHWTVTILNDEDFQVRNAMEAWSNAINRFEANVRAGQLPTEQSYKTTGLITQYNKSGVPVRTYKMVDLWPTVVSPIDVDWDQVDVIESFTVEFAYTFWEPVAPTLTGTFQV